MFKVSEIVKITDLRPKIEAYFTVNIFSIATGYGLEGPGIQSQWGRNFLHRSRPTLGTTQPPFKWVSDLFPGGKLAGAWR
jgi:hypothetical protein